MEETHRRRATQDKGNKVTNGKDYARTKEERSNKQATRFKPRISRVSELNLYIQGVGMASKANGKAARARNAYPSLPDVVDSNELKDIKRYK